MTATRDRELDDGQEPQPPIRLRVTIFIEVGASDFIEAASHQQKIEAFASTVRASYPAVALRFWEPRERVKAPSPVPRGIRSYTGRLHRYTDA